MQQFREELLAFWLKIWVWVAYIIIGMLGLFAQKIRSGKKITFAQAVSTTMVAGFIGYLASVWCVANESTKGAYIVPIATLLSDKIFTYILSLDWESIINTIEKPFRKKES